MAPLVEAVPLATVMKGTLACIPLALASISALVSTSAFALALPSVPVVTPVQAVPVPLFKKDFFFVPAANFIAVSLYLASVLDGPGLAPRSVDLPPASVNFALGNVSPLSAGKKSGAQCTTRSHAAFVFAFVGLLSILGSSAVWQDKLACGRSLSPEDMISSKT